MQARGPLMIEHRLIEQMLNVIQRTLEHVEQTGLHPPDWTKYVRVEGRSQSPLAREKGTCHETPPSICC